MNYPTEHNIYASTPRKTYFEVDTAVVKEPMTFEQISNALDVSIEEVIYFNPQYRKNEIPSGGYSLTLPKSKIGLFLTNESEIYAAIKSQKQQETVTESLAVKEVRKTHVVKRGEKISNIARKYGVTVADLKSWNSIGKKGVNAGKRLVVYVREEVKNPVTATPKSVDATKEPQSNLATTTHKDSTEEANTKLAENTVSTKGKYKYHKVNKGETLFGISKKYGISVEELKKLNNLSKKGQVQRGQTLKVKLVS